MAIIIEEEKKSNGNIIAAFGWLVIVLILVAAGYYLFLVSPPATIVSPPASFTNIQTLSAITIVPEDVTSSTIFMALQSQIPAIASSSLVVSGSTTPFLPTQ